MSPQLSPWCVCCAFWSSWSSLFPKKTFDVVTEQFLNKIKMHGFMHFICQKCKKCCMLFPSLLTHYNMLINQIKPPINHMEVCSYSMTEHGAIGDQTCTHTWPVEMEAPLRRARMSPDRCSILTTLTGTSNFLTYCSSGRFRKSNTNTPNTEIYYAKNMQTWNKLLSIWITSWALCSTRDQRKLCDYVMCCQCVCVCLGMDVCIPSTCTNTPPLFHNIKTRGLKRCIVAMVAAGVWGGEWWVITV